MHGSDSAPVDRVARSRSRQCEPSVNLTGTRSRIRFFFSSRRRHTRWNCDWSSDVCSSDLVFIADGKIAALGKAPAGFRAERTIDADKLVVCPGLIDLSARLREPGFEYKATLA